jgi:hypothetical protein
MLTLPAAPAYGHDGATQDTLQIPFPDGTVPTVDLILRAALRADVTGDAYRVFAACILGLPRDREWTSRAVQAAAGLTAKGAGRHLGALTAAGLLRSRRAVINGRDLYVYALAVTA